MTLSGGERNWICRRHNTGFISWRKTICATLPGIRRFRFMRLRDFSTRLSRGRLCDTGCGRIVPPCAITKSSIAATTWSAAQRPDNPPNKCWNGSAHLGMRQPVKEIARWVDHVERICAVGVRHPAAGRPVAGHGQIVVLLQSPTGDILPINSHLRRIEIRSEVFTFEPPNLVCPSQARFRRTGFSRRFARQSRW